MIPYAAVALLGFGSYLVSVLPSHVEVPARWWTAGAAAAGALLLLVLPTPVASAAIFGFAVLFPLLPLFVFRDALWEFLDRKGLMGALVAPLYPVVSFLVPLLLLLIPKVGVGLAFTVHLVFWAVAYSLGSTDEETYERFVGERPPI